MHVLFLSQYFHPEQFLNNTVAKELVARGHSVNVVCAVPNYPAGRFFDGYSNRRRGREQWNDIQIDRVITIPRGRSSFQLLANYIAYPLFASWRIARLGKNRGDVSFVSMPSPLFQAFAGIFAKRFFGVPTVYWVQDIWPDSAILTLGIKNRLVIGLLNELCGWIYRQADIVMVQSDGFHEAIAKFGVNPCRIVTLPNSAPDIFKPVEKSEVPDSFSAVIPSNRTIIMFAGNIGESQNFDNIIDAAALLPNDSNILIVVVGSGRDEARVKERIREGGLGHRFLFAGRYPEEAMPHFFACADAMLVSLKAYPIFALTVPSKVQAYMACGKPIVASLQGEGAKIIVEANAGFVVNPNSPAALSASLVQIEKFSPADLKKLGANGQDYFKRHFTTEILLDRLVTYLTIARDGQR